MQCPDEAAEKTWTDQELKNAAAWACADSRKELAFGEYAILVPVRGKTT